MCVRVCMYIIKKSNRLSFGYEKIISAGHSVRETDVFRLPLHNREKKV